jgi:hypothetical protein
MDSNPAVALGASSYYLVVWESVRPTQSTANDIYGLRVQSNGTLWAYTIPICTATGSQQSPDLAFNPNSGYFLVVWQDDRGGAQDIYGRFVDSYGNLIGTDFPISTASGSQRNPSVAYGARSGADPNDDEYVVVWEDWGVATGSRIMGRRVDKDGNLVGGEFQINGSTGNMHDPSVDYSVTLRRYMVVWSDKRNPHADIYGQRLNEDGSLDGGEKAVCTANEAQGRPEVRLNAFNYEWLVVWEDHRGSVTDPDIRARRLTSAGDPTGNEIVIAEGANNEQAPTVVYNINEYQFLVGWREWDYDGNQAFRVRRVNGDGTLDGSIVAVSAGRSEHLAPALVYDAYFSSTYLAVWQDRSDGSYGQIMGQRINDDATLEEDRRGISKWTEQSQGAVAYNPDDDEFFLVWRDRRGPDYDVWGQRLDGAGQPLGDSVFIAGGPDHQWLPDVAYSSYAGRYLVAWSAYDSLTSYDIRGQMVSADGSLYGLPFVICDVMEWQWNPAVASSDSADGFLVVWQEERFGITDSHIYGRRVANTGGVAGPEIQICTVADDQQSPDVAFAPSSGTNTDAYLVVWQDERWGTGWDIYGRYVQRNGALGSEYAITSSADHQELPAVAYNPDDDQFLVVWQFRSGITQDLYSQRVVAGGSPTGGMYPVCTQGDLQTTPAVAYNPAEDRYLVVWEDTRDGADAIYGRALTRGNMAAGPDFRACTYGSGQEYPDVAYNSTGGTFLLTWTDDRLRWQGKDIYARVIRGDILPFDIFLPLVPQE